MTAVDMFAQAAGARGGQLIGRAAVGLEAFHLASSDLLDAQNDWVAHGGLDPRVSPMVSMGLKAPLLTPYTDGHAIAEDARRRHELWRSVHERWDIPHVACTVLWRSHGHQIVVAALRSARQGRFQHGELRRQASLMPHWHAALQLSTALRGAGHQLVVGALEAVQADVFVLNGFGQVIAATRGAERLTASGSWFRLRHGSLAARNDANVSALEGAMIAGFRGAAPASIELIGAHGFLQVQVAKLPADLCDIGFGAAFLVICTDQLRVPKLTRTEREIARDLLRGLSLSAIADRRGRSVQTVKSQSKSIYAKAGVAGQLAFIERFSSEHRAADR
jgi:DNA-binding CsgD family transcriptional regulator